MAPGNIIQKLRDKAPPIPFASKPVFRPPPTEPNSSQTSSQRAPYWEPEFTINTPVSQHFQQETGQTGWGNQESQNYTNSPANSFFTGNGQLVVRGLVHVAAPTPEEKYTSARLITHQKLSRQSGCLTVRITAPCARGIWPAVWLLPAQPSKWPDDGEIDVFEAWNGEPVNHSCLHWGSYEAKDMNKHRVVETHVPDLSIPTGKEYSLVWQQREDGKDGQCIWYIGGTPVMKGKIPNSTKRLSEWQVIINIAMGGNVCQGVTPDDGTYDLVIHRIQMFDDPPHGWDGFKNDWRKAKEGHTL